MKKSIIMFAAAVLAGIVITGCSAVGTQHGMPVLGSMGPNFFTATTYNATLPVQPADFTIVKSGVSAEAVLESFFTCINIGDASYETLKGKILAQAPGADDIANVAVDYKQRTVFGITTVTVKMTANAVRTK